MGRGGEGEDLREKTKEEDRRGKGERSKRRGRRGEVQEDRSREMN
jgi:hypothetical protein